jgi:RNA polymerase sigma-70 factor (ECF subfamily)
VRAFAARVILFVTRRSEVAMAQGDVPKASGATGQGLRRERIVLLVLRRGKLSPQEVGLLREVFPEILAAHQHTIWTRLRRRGLSVVDSEEVFQDAFLDLFTDIVANGFPDELEQRLWTITRCRFLDLLRARHRCREIAGLPSSGSEKPPSAPDVDRALDLHGVAHRALDLLTPEHREVVDAVVLGGFSHREAAEVLGLPEGTLKSRLLAAKEALLTHVDLLLPPSQRLQ